MAQDGRFHASSLKWWDLRYKHASDAAGCLDAVHSSEKVACDDELSFGYSIGAWTMDPVTQRGASKVSFPLFRISPCVGHRLRFFTLLPLPPV